ncbi:MAG: tryptophan 2,3-dioxygenase family protein, partial [Bacteroidota bacterium]
MNLTHEMLERLDELEQKYAVMGQDMQSYLDGLLHADYLTYWNYIHLDTLLSLQNPKTPFPDEQIFIMYHQITELYFKLIILALRQLIAEEQPDPAFFLRQIKRANRYFEILIHSFDVMVEGMDKEEFLKFRMSLLPASGFQSAQFRKIEILSTNLVQLVHYTKREEFDVYSPIELMYPNLYWKSGATELATGKKTLTLKQFEQKYSNEFIWLAGEMREKNILQKYLHLPPEAQQDTALKEALRTFDFQANVLWPLSHYKSAVRYLDRKPDIIEAT